MCCWGVRLQFATAVLSDSSIISCWSSKEWQSKTRESAKCKSLLTTWCLCCHYPVNGNNKHKWREGVSLLDACVDSKSFWAATVHYRVFWALIRIFHYVDFFFGGRGGWGEGVGVEGGGSIFCCFIPQDFPMYAAEGLLKVDETDCEVVCYSKHSSITILKVVIWSTQILLRRNPNCSTLRSMSILFVILHKRNPLKTLPVSDSRVIPLQIWEVSFLWKFDDQAVYNMKQC